MAITKRALKVMVAALKQPGTKFQLSLLLFFIILMAVVFAHIIVGFLLPMLQQSGYENKAILESFLMVVLIWPFIWGLIVKRRHAEEAQKESEQRCRSLAESAHDMIFIIDSEDRVEYINQFGAESLGCRPEEIIGKQREKIFPPDISNRQKGALQKVIETGKPDYVEGITPFRDYTLWLSTWLVPLRDGTGKVKSVLGISRDITERKRAVEKLKENETRLAQAQRIAHIGSWEYNFQTNEF